MSTGQINFAPYSFPSEVTVPWPVHPVKQDGDGFAIGQQSHTPALEVLLTRLALAIEAQSQAINRLAESNQGLIRAMAEDAGMDGDDEPKGYLNARTL